MTGHDGFPGGAEYGGNFAITPRAVIADYFTRVNRPTPAEMLAAGDVVGAAYREIERTNDAHTICHDLVSSVRAAEAGHMAPTATTVLAGMFEADDPVIPGRWRHDEGNVRRVLSMVGVMEIAYIQAAQFAIEGGGTFPGALEDMAEIQQFVTALRQQR